MKLSQNVLLDTPSHLTASPGLSGSQSPPRLQGKKYLENRWNLDMGPILDEISSSQSNSLIIESIFYAGCSKKKKKKETAIMQLKLGSRGYLWVHFDHKNGTFDYLHQVLYSFTLKHEI